MSRAAHITASASASLARFAARLGGVPRAGWLFVGSAFLVAVALACLAPQTARAAAAAAGSSAEPPTQPDKPPGIHWNVNAAGIAVIEVTGLSASKVEELSRAELTPEEWAKVFPVFAGQSDLLYPPSIAKPGSRLPAPPTPMLGTWRVQDGRPRFEPQFPLARGVIYTARFQFVQLPVPVATLSEYQLPADLSPPSTVVTAVFPGADVLPENLLKFYVQFSAPMATGAGLAHLRLLDAAGQEIADPFLSIAAELWDVGMTRLTVFIDPGRIKRGVRPNLEVGPVFEEGKGYTLVIDAAWRDAAGRPLKEAFRKNFRAGPADREAIAPARWTVRAPATGTRRPLTVEFGEPLD